MGPKLMMKQMAPNKKIEATGNNACSFSVSGLCPCASFRSFEPIFIKRKNITDNGRKTKMVFALDPSGFRTEAIDILFNLNMRKENPTLIVKQVLDQAFDLAFSLEECRAAGDKLTELLRKQ